MKEYEYIIRKDGARKSAGTILAKSRKQAQAELEANVEDLDGEWEVVTW